MKKAFIFSVAVIASAAMSFVNPPNKLVGRWQQRWSNGAIMLANFRPDGSYDAFVNGKAFVSGKYYVRQNTFGLSDAGCNLAYYGTYRIDYFAQDSLRFTAIQDTCTRRRRGNDKATFGRVTSGR